MYTMKQLQIFQVWNSYLTNSHKYLYKLLLLLLDYLQSISISGVRRAYGACAGQLARVSDGNGVTNLVTIIIDAVCKQPSCLERFEITIGTTHRHERCQTSFLHQVMSRCAVYDNKIRPNTI